MKKRTFEQLERDYFAHMNGWGLPRKMRFYCSRCGVEHLGAQMMRYGQYAYYKLEPDDSYSLVKCDAGVFRCISATLETAEI